MGMITKRILFKIDFRLKAHPCYIISVSLAEEQAYCTGDLGRVSQLP